MRNFTIKADFDCLVLLNGKKLGVLEGGQITFMENDKFTLTFFPLDNKSLPYSCQVSYENGQLVCSNNLSSYVEFPNKNFELYFVPFIIKYSKPTLICTKTLDTNIGKVCINIFNNNNDSTCSLIQVLKNNEIILEHQTLGKINNCDIQDKFIDNGYFVFISGQIQDYEYLLVLVVDKSIETNLELIAHQVELHPDCIKTLTKCFDIHKRGKVIEYSVVNGKFAEKTNYLVAINDNVKIKDELIPYAFFEALKVGDIKKCREYLSDELNESVDDEHLVSYFNDFEEVRQDVYTNEDSSVILIYKNANNYVGKICKLEFKNNKIDNFNLLD